eukprot:2827911-Alexandrium_andersonii.AAC.1
MNTGNAVKQATTGARGARIDGCESKCGPCTGAAAQESAPVMPACTSCTEKLGAPGCAQWALLCASG